MFDHSPPPPLTKRKIVSASLRSVKFKIRKYFNQKHYLHSFYQYQFTIKINENKSRYDKFSSFLLFYT